MWDVLIKQGFRPTSPTSSPGPAAQTFSHGDSPDQFISGSTAPHYQTVLEVRQLERPGASQVLVEHILLGDYPSNTVTSELPGTLDEHVVEELRGTSQYPSAPSWDNPASALSNGNPTTAIFPPAQPEGVEDPATKSRTKETPSVTVVHISPPKLSQSEAPISSSKPLQLDARESSVVAERECRYCLRKNRGGTLYSEAALR